MQTPRTDSVAEVRIVKCQPREIVDADFARKLEKEIEELKWKLSMMEIKKR